LKPQIDSLRIVLTPVSEVIFALLIGSRADGLARADSDWDIAVWVPREISGLNRLSLLETLRMEMAQSLDISPAKVDVIDLPYAGLAMRAVVANEGILLKQDDGSFYNRFLTRTWRELEEFQWESAHAA
jgi:predicted nucleotidyltransferase